MARTLCMQEFWRNRPELRNPCWKRGFSPMSLHGPSVLLTRPS